MRLLLVEDDEILGDGLVAGLKMEGYAVDWLTNGKLANEALKLNSYELIVLLSYCKDLREPKQLSLLHCDYIGRNLLATSCNKISGVLDFEAARIGDAVYDLAKMVWVDIDFSDLELRNAFLQGWEITYGEEVPQREFLCYVGIQCLAAIAWTDKNAPIEGNTIFRASAIRALRIVLNELRTGF